MASQINPNNIDGTYPIAGQDNNSQGFRDNFTNIKLNFQYAEDEINALQTNGAVLNGINNFNDNLIYAAKLQDLCATKAIVTTSSGSVSINYSAGHYQTVTTTGSISLAFTSWPVTGSYGWVRLQIHITNTAYTVTLPSAVSLGINNLQGYNSSTRAITFNATGYYELEFTTYDGGSTITVHDCTRNADPVYLPSSEDLDNGAAVSLTTTASYFSTLTGETATLANGREGQIKTLMMNGYLGTMTITVAAAGWNSGASGTITFNALGEGCTLQFINSRWFCIGNNGAAFA